MTAVSSLLLSTPGHGSPLTTLFHPCTSLPSKSQSLYRPCHSSSAQPSPTSFLASSSSPQLFLFSPPSLRFLVLPITVNLIWLLLTTHCPAPASITPWLSGESNHPNYIIVTLHTQSRPLNFQLYFPSPFHLPQRSGKERGKAWEALEIPKRDQDLCLHPADGHEPRNQPHQKSHTFLHPLGCSQPSCWYLILTFILAVLYRVALRKGWKHGGNSTAIL